MVRAGAATEPPGGRPKATKNRLVHSVAVANIKSQIKRNRQNERRHERNKGVRSALKTDAKKVRTSIAEGDTEAARQRLLEASRSLDKAASYGVVHKRAAARRKSRLAKAVNASPAE
jgi:small subunit ribosomal protein S20